MVYLKLYTLIRILSSICLIAIVSEYWRSGLIGTSFILSPYIIVSLLANKNAYKTKLKLVCRSVGGVLVSILAIGLLIGIDADPQASIGIGFTIIMQYGIIFVSEAIIGLATYEESNS
jgi:hypothetical protein